MSQAMYRDFVGCFHHRLYTEVRESDEIQLGQDYLKDGKVLKYVISLPEARRLAKHGNHYAIDFLHRRRNNDCQAESLS